LSTLTKVLIVLLTVFSLFLCGIVVTYVANAENQRKRADTVQQQLQSAKQRQEAAIASEAQQKQEAEALKADLGKQLADLNTLRTQLEAEIDRLKRDNSQKDQEARDASARVALATETSSKLSDQAASAEKEVKSLQASLTNLNKELQETTQALMERMAVLTDMEKRNRQLIEEKQAIEVQLSQVLQQYGRAPLRPQTVTAPQTTAQPIQRALSQQGTQAPQAQTRAIALNGRITQIDMKNKVAAISIGSAAGVRADMKFHVTRGDRFVCDILIFDVDAEKAIGTLDLVQVEPQTGDLVTTNL
jgi:chromosome segregation ATPase